MAYEHLTRRFARTEEAIITLFCLVDDAYYHLNPRARCYESLKRLSDSEVIALALFGQLRGIESERSFLRDAERFFSHLFPGVVGLHPSSLHRRGRKTRRFFGTPPGGGVFPRGGGAGPAPCGSPPPFLFAPPAVPPRAGLGG